MTESKMITKIELDAAVAKSPFRCPGGVDCTCCNVPGGCDCGCRDACPVFRGRVWKLLKQGLQAASAD